MASTYVMITSGGYLHIKAGKGRTVCGRDYARLDYLPVSEDEFNPNYHVICHKCSGKPHKRTTIASVFGAPGKALG